MKPLFTGSSWDFPLLTRIDDACRAIAVEELGLTFYPNQLEIITSEQMLDVYACSLPITYKHWKFGKNFVRESYNYRKGRSGLAYEVVFNSDPCIAYLMEENSATMQTLVIAHASYGHNSFFANNYLFKTWTDADAILDYLVFARDYIAKCEVLYGAEAVEATLDSCHALENYGVDRYKRPAKLSKELSEKREKDRAETARKEVDALWANVIPNKPEPLEDAITEMSPQENILYFLEKKAPGLKTWQRELVRITRKISQYFYPQRQTQVMNEGWASTCHYYIMTRLMEKGLITEGSYLEFLHSHTGVVYQRKGSDFNGFNPYWLGFNMFAEIRRICQEPTKEDCKFFPDLAGTDWLKSWHYAMNNFRDESFITQYLSPAMVRRERMFLLEDSPEQSKYLISKIQDERGFEHVRAALSNRYKLGSVIADIQITSVNTDTDRRMTLKHTAYDGVTLDEKSARQTLQHIKNLWGYDVSLYSEDSSTGQVLAELATDKN